jgi:2-polyprenyl-6-methoxyphenol hydroxylase-like FAD-dependent oxidoreductase
MMRKPKIAIVGAGIGGLTAATAMRRRNIDVDVYEQSPQIAEIGAGVSLSPNAIKAFRALDLDAAIAGIGFESDNQVVRAWNNGDVLSKVFRKGIYQEEFGAPYLSVHRADLVEVLHQQLPDDAIHLGKRCTDVETNGPASTGDNASA